MSNSTETSSGLYVGRPSFAEGDNPYPRYKRLRDDDPVHWDGTVNSYLVTRYADVEAVLLDHERFSNIRLPVLSGEQPRLSPVLERDPPQHKFLRDMLMPLFTPSALRKRDDLFKQLAIEYLDKAEQRDVVDAHSDLAIPIPGIVTMDVLGLPRESAERFLTLTDERLMILQDRGNPNVKHRDWDDVQKDLWDVAEPIWYERVTAPRNDLISALVAAHAKHGEELILDDFRFDEDFIVDMLLHVMTGGFHTTQHLIELLIDFYADHPEMWLRLRDNRKLIDVAIEEMLRWEAPVQMLQRRVKADDVVIHGTRIPRDAHISVVYGSANRDERVFEDPDTYSLDRTPQRHFAFSLGIHYCPGSPVTRFEVRALLNEMLDRYSRIERVGPSERDPSTYMRGWGYVPVRFHAN